MSIIDERFAPVYGLPCWNFQKGYSSFLVAEFGQPSLEIREPRNNPNAKNPVIRNQFLRRNVTLRGEWHLWIYCCYWEIYHKGKRLSTAEQDDDTINSAAVEINGQKLVKVSIEEESTTVFDFDLEGQLITKQWTNWDGPEPVEMWYLYEPNGKVLTFRSDGCYSYIRSKGETETEEDWNRIA